MGCDIHGWLEVKREYTPNLACWQAYLNLENILERDYFMFSRLFGVRGSSIVVSEYLHRSLPKDLDEITSKAMEFWEADGHHYICAFWNELKDTYLQALQNRAPYFQEDIDRWTELYEVCEVLGKYHKPENIRFIVWFDS